MTSAEAGEVLAIVCLAIVFLPALLRAIFGEDSGDYF